MINHSPKFSYNYKYFNNLIYQHTFVNYADSVFKSIKPIRFFFSFFIGKN